MSSHDWMRHDHTPTRRVEPSYPETVVWTLTKDTRTAQAIIRRLPHGRELRINMNGSLLWSELFPPARDGELEPIADEKRGDFCARGWM